MWKRVKKETHVVWDGALDSGILCRNTLVYYELILNVMHETGSLSGLPTKSL